LILFSPAQPDREWAKQDPFPKPTCPTLQGTAVETCDLRIMKRGAAQALSLVALYEGILGLEQKNLITPAL
jgi:hypothetical protein